MRRDCDDDPEKAAIHARLAEDDTPYYVTMFCPIYEPRDTIDYEWDGEEWVPFEKPPGWYPWIPFPFQVDMIHWIEKVKSTTRLTDKTGKADGVVEKSREMGASWIFCAVAAHDFLFGHNQEIGFISYKEEVVDKKGSSKSLFYKLRALIGVFDKVPTHARAPETMWDGLAVRLPDFLIPRGFMPKRDDQVNQILHPTRNNALRGNSTSGKTGLGDRLSWVLIDESAKNEDLLTIWGGLQGTTYHRFANSSADLRWGDDFFRLARNAERATKFNEKGPSFFPVPWNVHPLRDEDWLEAERARSDLDPYQFAREYEMDYHAGFGDWVYPYAKQMQVAPAPYKHGDGPVTGTIDPSVADPTAVILLQGIPGNGRTRAFDALMLKTPNAAMLAPILMGFPPGHEEWDECPPEARDFMALMWELRQNGESITWVGDPYGKSNLGSGKGTFYDTLLTTSVEKSDQYPELPPVKVVVQWDYDNDARYHPGRKEALATLLPSLDIHDCYGGRQLLDALQSHRYKPEDKATTERLVPEHGWGSHLVTAAEFYAVNDKIIRDTIRFRRATIPGPHVAPPTRRTPQKPRRLHAA